MLPQDRNSLLFGIAVALYVETSLQSKYREIPNAAWLELRGYGHRSSYGYAEKCGSGFQGALLENQVRGFHETSRDFSVVIRFCHS